MGQQYIFQIEDLVKKHGQREVLKNIWLSFYPGAKIGVLARPIPGTPYVIRGGIKYGVPRFVPIGSVQLLKSPDTVAFTTIAGSVPGITFGASVTVPAGFGPGKWYFGQLMSGDRAWKLSGSGGCHSKDTHGVPVNDNPWPYSAGTTVPPPWDCGFTVYSASDSPYSLLAAKVQDFASAGWNTYIMFKPAPDPPGAGMESSAWVPLRRVSWMVNWCTEYLNNKWLLISQSASRGSWVDERKPPEWTKCWAAILGDSTCPPVCS